MILNNAINIDRPSSEPISLKRADNFENDKKRLQKAVKEMESVFLYQLLKTMRQTIPETKLNEDGMLGGGMGKDIYTQMFDQEIATKMSGNGDKSIAAMLYKSMVKVLETQSGVENSNPVELKDIFPTRKFMKINEVNGPDNNKISSKRIGGRGDRPSSDYNEIIEAVAEKYRINPSLVKAVIKSESNFDPKAVSPAGAKGLMQLIDSTASDMGVTNVYDPKENIEGGVKYLRAMINKFGNIKEALAAYNAGPGTVEKYGGPPPYRETTKYIKNVLKLAGKESLYY